MTTHSEAPVALFDLDGTLADFDLDMRERMVMLAGPGEPSWDPDREGDEPEHIKQRRRIIKSVPGFWTGLRIMSDGFQLMDMAHQIGFRLMILSRGPSQNSLAWKEKIDWCRQNIAFPHEITLTEDKGLVYGRVLVDDWPPYIEQWLAFRPRGQIIMPARRWNASFYGPRIYRYVDRRQDSEVMGILQAQFQRQIDSARLTAPRGVSP
jgi:5'-nucleotidase